jgi:FdhD protein
MLQKAARMGTPVIISCTAVTSLAAMMAEAWGLTLIGYARQDKFVVYTHSERIKPQSKQVIIA